MKNILMKITCFAVICFIIASLSVIGVSAASANAVIICDTSIKPGDNVAVTVRTNADVELWGVEMTVTYNSSVIQYVSGATHASGSTLTVADTPDGKTSSNVTLNFKAIAEGKASIQVSGTCSDGTSKIPIGASANITVKAKDTAPSSSKKPTSSTPAVLSTDASLSGLNVSGWAVTPAFSADVTSYSITVENSIAVASINASAAKKGAKVAGTGDKELQVGDSKFTITVTAPDVVAESGYEFIGWATTENATVAQVSGSKIGYADVKELLNDGAVVLYPVFAQKQVDLVVYIHLSATSSVYITETEADAIESAIATLYAGKIVCFVRIEGKNAAGFVSAISDATNVDIYIGGNKADGITFDSEYGKTAVGTGHFENTSRKVGIIDGCANKETAIALYQYLTANKVVE